MDKNIEHMLTKCRNCPRQKQIVELPRQKHKEKCQSEPIDQVDGRGAKGTQKNDSTEDMKWERMLIPIGMGHMGKRRGMRETMS